jgi:cytochrome b561
MKTMARRSLAAAELLLVFPAALFMTALFVRSIQPQQYEPAHTAQRIVDWYAASTHLGLWLLMITLPLLVTIVGCIAVVQSWRNDEAFRQAARNTLVNLRAHLATFLILMATAAAAGILVIVAVHVATD